MARKYAAILGNLGNTRDRFCSGYKTNPTTVEMLRQAASLPIGGIELVGTWDIRPENAREMKRALDDQAQPGRCRDRRGGWRARCEGTPR